ncbi:hypothetical protein CCHR01_07772 [Colletotrichum chrysophilum]|uniref:Uncharacterized protein n=1 Tax=Colletotrichum chrysophilum TaxID=1836956 RepID=A0AAD9AL40_9PEZI|nr:hypothetical protein CCHR01_07772 [Colletotrichum chrysophilum]
MAWLVSVLAFYDAALEKLHQHSEHYSRRQQYQDRQTSQQGGKFVFTFVFNGNEWLPRGVQKRPLIFQPFTTLESIYGKLRQDFSYKLLAALLCLGVGPYAIMTPRFFSIFGYSFQHPRASANTDYRLRTQHSWTGNDRITTFYFLLLAIPLAQAVCFLLLWPYTIGKLENSRYRGVRHGKKAQMRRRGLPLLEMEYIGIVAWNRPLRGWRETERGRRKTKIGLKSREEGRKGLGMPGRLDRWPTQTAHSSGRGNWGFLGPFAGQS